MGDKLSPIYINDNHLALINMMGFFFIRFLRLQTSAALKKVS